MNFNSLKPSLSGEDSQPMNVPKAMTLFHLSFLLLGMLSLVLMTIKVISLDWSAFWIIVIAVFLNALFGVLWTDETRRRVKKLEVAPKVKRVFPMVSFVVPAYNAEKDITRCVNSLFECAMSYRGPSEIIIVDDGSADNTYESAWAAANSKRKEFAHVRAVVVRHMANLGKAEAVRTGANKAMGEYMALVDAAAFCDPAWLNNLVDYICAAERVAARYEAYLRSPDARTVTPSLIRLYRADALRRLLNEEQTSKTAESLEILPETPKKKIDAT